jgi:tetratricopeptide (TPR) repeat protein
MIDIGALRYLGNLKFGAELYYSVLMHDRHEILAIGAACKLMEKGLGLDQYFDRLVELSRHRAVRDKLLPTLFDAYPQEMALTILDQEVCPEKFSVDDLIRARMARDPEKTIECHCELFKATGDFERIEDALAVSPQASSIEVAIEIAVINILLAPENGLWALSLFDSLISRGANESLRELLVILEENDQYEALASIIKIRLALSSGQHDIAEQGLERLGAFELPEPVQFQTNKMFAEFFDAQGRYQEACEYYNKQNMWIRSEAYKEGAYLEYVTQLNNIKFSPTPPDTQANYLMMLGFPRSGTTLLENILDSHPSIRSLEEIGSLVEPDTLLRRYLANHPDMEAVPPEMIMRMRAAYYDSLNVGVDADSARFVIDKMPIMSSRATYLKNLFGNKRYIFSIRHPYDVVLSCFKQAFGTNLAMDCFTSFEESCRTYDFVMELWFSNFDLDSKDVCYVKYDDLCTKFDEEVTRVLNFIGVDWDPAVRNFAENAKMRAQKTPSYGKVKLGNTIGVQSSWRKYQFLFEKPDARILDKWVTFFGYEGLS